MTKKWKCIIVSPPDRCTRTADETTLIGEEKIRLRRHQEELRRLLKAACLSGAVFFRGNDRSPGDRAVDVGKSAAEILGHVLPEVFERFKEAAARTSDLKKASTPSSRPIPSAAAAGRS